jgi:hypothetical protein
MPADGVATIAIAFAVRPITPGEAFQVHRAPSGDVGQAPRGSLAVCG